MTTIFRYRLRRFRGQILGWGLALSLVVLLIVGIYDSFAPQQEQMEQLLANYPPELMAFFGAAGPEFSLFSAEGFISMEFFSFMPVVLGIFALLMGSGLLVSDEEKGTLDLIMAHPVSRSALFLGRLLAFVSATRVGPVAGGQLLRHRAGHDKRGSAGNRQILSSELLPVRAGL